MFKVGDEVLIKGKVENVEGYGAVIFVGGLGKAFFKEEELIPVDKTYEQGLADAWELAKKIVCHEEQGGMSIPCFSAIFDEYMTVEEVLASLTAEEALAKIEAYEKEKEIKVGDEVIVCTMSGSEFDAVVTCKYDKEADVMYKGGNVANHVPLRLLKKTGKHIDIESLLRQIGE